MKLTPLLLLVVVIQGCYSIRQVYHNGKLLLSSEPIDEIIQEKKYSEEIRTKLSQSKAILEYAKREGLNVESAYSDYIHTDRDNVAYLVKAAPKEKLEFKTWWFFIVGRVPYLGFYDEKERDEKARELEDEGYDIHKAEAAAFSSLGWFDDPVFTSMLQKSDVALSELLFHELIHRSFWWPGKPKLNETLAEFLAGKLVERYFLSRGEPHKIEQFLLQRQDRIKFEAWVDNLKQKLAEYYASIDTSAQQLPDDFKQQKQAIIQQKKQNASEYNFQNDLWVKYIQSQDWNNASILSVSLYESSSPQMQAAFSCYNSKPIKDFLNALEKALERDESEAVLNELCSILK